MAEQSGQLQLDDETLAQLEMSIDEARKIVTPIKIGPTWQTADDGSWILPEHTLGWQIAGWCSRWLKAENGTPWRFTKEQLRFVLWWYAVDGAGRFVYRTGVLQRMKGWGKDPLLAVLCLVELVGPSRFSGWDADGQPVAAPHPRAWVQVSAVNQSQTTNTMEMLPALMSEEFISHFNITPGAELIRANGGRQRLEAVTSSYRALEGKRTTFTLLNETHHWVSGNNGHKMYETIRGNVTKTGSRFLAITNAYLPGEDSVAQRMRESYERVVEGKAVDAKMLYDSLEAGPQVPLSGPLLLASLYRVRGDAIWLEPEDIVVEIADTTIGAARSRRMWLNQVVAEEDSLHSPATWDPLADEDAILHAGDEIVLGFDGGKSDDATVLVALRIRDRCAFVLCLEEAPDGPEAEHWTVNRQTVDSAVHEAFQLYSVRAFFADVAQWESYISDWSDTYGHLLSVNANGKEPIAWDMRRSLMLVTRAHESLMQAIFDRRIHHDGDVRLRRHVLNAKRRNNKFGVSFGKVSRESSRKVDAYAALMLAHTALEQLRLNKSTKTERTGNGWFF